MSCLFRRHLYRCCTAVCLTAVCLAVGGCGSAPEPVEQTGQDEDSDSEATASSAASKGTKSKNSRTAAAQSDRVTVDGIPLDVFFDEPLAVANDSRTIGGTAPAAAMAATPAPAQAVAPAPEPAPAAAAAGADVKWADLISATAIADEMQACKNELTTRLTNVGAYNRSYLEIPVFGTEVAFLAGIAQQHSGDIAWKDKAKYIRVLGAKMAEITGSSDAKSRKSYEEVNAAFLTISEILNGNSPAELPDAEDEASFETFADMGYMMKRLERASSWLQTNTGSEDGMKSKADVARREVSLIAAIAAAFAMEGYGYGPDDTEFTGHTFQMRDAASGMFKAASDGNFSEYDLQRSKVNQKCTECHSTYRNG